MSKERIHINYTAEDIEQYLSGKFSDAQMHELEKAALDDPFLSEAIEGYEGMKEKDWKSQLVAVRRQMAEANTVAKVIPLHKSTGKWWKIAAAVFLVISGALLTFVLTKDNPEEKNNKQIAQTVSTAPDSVPLKDNTAIKPVVKPDQPVSTATKENRTTANGLNAQNNPSGKANDEYANVPGKIQFPDPAKSDQGAVMDSVRTKLTAISKQHTPSSANNNDLSVVEATNSKSREAAKQNNIAEPANRQNAAANAFKKEQQSVNYNFIAQVVAPDNSPLPFSNISIKSENFGTYADVKGNFRLVSTDTILTIEVKSVGYLPRTFLLRKDLPQNKIVLLEDEVAIKEKTVIQKDMGNLRRSRRARLVMDSVVNAEPADGWDNYNTYVANNIELSDDALNKGLHGEVGISFDIKADGAITNIRVDKSLGNDYDEAARRLIEQGPQWKVKKGKKTSARVKVQF